MSSSTTTTPAKGTASSSALLSGEPLERRLEELLNQDRFAPPEHFVAAERVNDASLARAEADPDAFWAEQARELHWDEPFRTVLDRAVSDHAQRQARRSADLERNQLHASGDVGGH